MVFLARQAAAALAAASVATQQKAADALETAAREWITTVLGPDAGADVLIAEDVQVDNHLAVLSDAQVYLAVTEADGDAAAVWLVHDTGGGGAHEWTRVAQVASLAELGAALAEQSGGEA
ncbi:hypothetical protein [Enterococcus hirae]|uniref:hypothetical protein n=1 Tax=Enterococcus hirae TaxID=1354 RepID=UPI00136C4819|nr:hypothetical protein [Enterococcus hirae]NAE18086.1 hypothetical protein [Enterococcus hirae]